jgi:FAD/FMN-containing dehydrogenase
VRVLAEQIRERGARACSGKERRAGGEPLRFRKSSVSHFVPAPGRRPDDRDGKARSAEDRAVDVKPLDRLLELDPEARIARAEPGLTFKELLSHTTRHGLMPYCVPELEEITVGGAVSGCSLESMSYRHGGFHDRCLAYEIVDGRGEVVRCSREEDPELFHMIHGSYGTLGRLTEVTFELTDAKPFVQMDYISFDRFDDYWELLRDRCELDQDQKRHHQGHDFVDSIIHAPDRLVACIGTMVDEAPWVSDYTREKIYYRSTAERSRDYLDLAGYCFRYDTECHWLSRTVPPLENPLVRRLVGRWFLGSTNLITWSNRLKPLLALQRRPDVVVDVFIPAARFKEFFEWYVQTFDFWPLWVVPYRMPDPPYPWISDEWRSRLGDFVIDCAVYGKPNRRKDVDLSEVLEKKVLELGGIKTLISKNHYDRETFWTIYDKPAWSRVKERTDPKNLFGDLYEKTHPAA